MNVTVYQSSLHACIKQQALQEFWVYKEKNIQLIIALEARDATLFQTKLAL